MPIAQSELLFDLIKSLSKSEKRHFRLYTNRLERNQEGLYIQLFDLIDRVAEPEEKKLMQKLSIRSVNKFSNLKRHLYSQIVKSLRLMHISKTPSIKIREHLDYATVLYGKGLFHQSLHILERAKSWALNAGRSMIYLEILELQKKIESRHITRSRKIKNRIEGLISESMKMRQSVASTSEISDLSLSIQGLYIKFGFVRSERDALLVRSFFNSHQPTLDVIGASFYARVLWSQCQVWYHYMLMDFRTSKQHALDWIDAFEANPTTIEADPDLYIRGLHYYLTCAYYLKERTSFNNAFRQFELFNDKYLGGLNTNSKVLVFSYYQNAVLNKMVLENDYSKTESVFELINQSLEDYQNKLDTHRIQVFQYKMGVIYFYKGDYDKALDLFNMILSSSVDILKSDLFCYTRFLHLLSHFSIENFDLVDTLLPSVRLTFNNQNHSNELMDQVFVFLRKATKAMNFGLKDEISSLLEKMENSSFGKVSFLYFDFISWLGSLKANTSIEKFKR